MTTFLRLIHDDGGREISVAVHGLEPGWSDYDCDILERQVHRAELRGSVYVLHWPANIVARESIIRGDWRKIRAADEAGRSLARALGRLRDGQDRPITLIGHSQGTLVIHSALEWLAERARRVQRVLLMGGVVQSDAQLWENVAPAVGLEIVNVHSSEDGWLRPLWNPIGREAIGSRFRKIRDRKIALRHFDYWPNLSYVLDRVWPKRRRSRNYHPRVEFGCAWCGMRLTSLAKEKVYCPGCKVDFHYSLTDDSCYYGIEPKERQCSFCESGTTWVQESAFYGCDDPTCHRLNNMEREGNKVWILNSP